MNFEVVKLRMCSDRGSGGHKRGFNDTMSKIFFESGYEGVNLEFTSRKERTEYIKNLLHKYSFLTEGSDKSRIKVWLKNNLIPMDEINEIFKYLGFGVKFHTETYNNNIKPITVELPKNPTDLELYTLYRYKDVSVDTLVRFYKLKKGDLMDLFGEMFYQKCMSAKDTCVLSGMLEHERPKCKLPGCDNLTNWISTLPKKRVAGWGVFCCQKHVGEYIKLYPDVSLRRRDIVKRRRILQEIANKTVTTQIQLGKFISKRSKNNKFACQKYASRFARRLERVGFITREKYLICIPVFRCKKIQNIITHTYKLSVTEKGITEIKRLKIQNRV